MIEYDLEDQQEKEQFEEDKQDTVSKEVYQKLKEQKRYQKYYEMKNKLAALKHKAKIIKKNGIDYYTCDHCKKQYKKINITLMYSAKGEYAYCSDCVKELYPNYKHKLTNVINPILV